MRPLDDVERSVVDLKVTTTAATDQRVLGDAFAALEESLQIDNDGAEPSSWRGILGRKMVKLAAGAVIVVTALIVARVITPLRQEPPISPPPVRNGVEETEFDRIAAVFIADDVNSLVGMLSTGQFESKVLAALCLGEIGDERALPELERLYLLAETKRPEGYTENPFTEPIEKIRNRARGELRESRAEGEPEIEVKEKQIQAAVSKFEFRPKGVLSGLVTDAGTGEPISEAKVSISMRRSYSTFTDANGFYYFGNIEDEGGYKVGVWSSAYIGPDGRELPKVNLSKDSQAVKHFALERACQVEMQVVDEQDEPVEGAQVRVSSLAGEHGSVFGDMSDAASGTADDEGVVMLGGIEPSETPYLITAVHQEFLPMGKNDDFVCTIESYCAPAKLLVTLNNPEVIESAEIVMKSGVAVRGYAEYSDGVPAEGLKITAYPEWWRCTLHPEILPIDPNGYFTLPHVVPGTYNIHIWTPGRTLNVLRTALPSEEELLLVRLPKKSPTSLVSISGTISFVGDQRPQYVTAIAISSARDVHNANITPGQDTFMIDSLEPGFYTLSFSGPTVEQKVLRNIKAPSSALEVELRCLDKPKLRGMVIEAKTGALVRSFKARAMPVKTFAAAQQPPAGAWHEFQNANGLFEMEAVGPGTYQVQIAAEGFAWGWSEEINTDESRPIVVELRAGGIIKGKVINENGEPVSGATVIPLSKARGSAPYNKDAFVCEEGSVKTVNGEFILEDIAAGTETIKVTHADYGSAMVKDIAVVEAETTSTVQVILTSAGAVEGYVYDDQGRPQPNVTLFFRDASGSEDSGLLGKAVTDADGFYRIEGLPEQLCYVNRSDASSSLGVVCRALAPEKGKTAGLDFGGEPVVSGRVLIDGRPLAQARVLMGDPYILGFKCYSMTDSDGWFAFAGVPAGLREVYYEIPSKDNRWVKIATIEMGEADMDVGIIPEHTARVLISVNAVDDNEPLVGLKVYLQEGTEFWVPKVGETAEPAQEGEPYVVTNALPGTYTAVACRSDDVMIRQIIELGEEQEELKVFLRIPKGTAAVSGELLTDYRQPLLMWRSDEKVTAHITPSYDGTYKVENLPAGPYSIGRYLIGKSAPLAQFTLYEDETRIVDIDASRWSASEKASLHTQVVNEKGVPLAAAEVWLDGQTGVIEPLTPVGEGQFFVADPGEYALHAAYPGYKEAAQRIWLEARDIGLTPTADSMIIVRLEKK